MEKSEELDFIELFLRYMTPQIHKDSGVDFNKPGFWHLKGVDLQYFPTSYRVVKEYG